MILNLKGLAKKIRQSQDEKGQGLVEYALILVLVAIVVIAVLLTLGPTVSGVYCQVANALQPGSCTAAAEERVEGPWTWGGPAIDGCTELGLTGTGEEHYIWSNNSSLSQPGSVFWVSTSSSVGPDPTASHPNIHYIGSGGNCN